MENELFVPPALPKNPSSFGLPKQPKSNISAKTSLRNSRQICKTTSLPQDAPEIADPTSPPQQLLEDRSLKFRNSEPQPMPTANKQRKKKSSEKSRNRHKREFKNLSKLPEMPLNGTKATDIQMNVNTIAHIIEIDANEELARKSAISEKAESMENPIENAPEVTAEKQSQDDQKEDQAEVIENKGMIENGGDTENQPTKELKPEVIEKRRLVVKKNSITFSFDSDVKDLDDNDEEDGEKPEPEDCAETDEISIRLIEFGKLVTDTSNLEIRERSQSVSVKVRPQFSHKKYNDPERKLRRSSSNAGEHLLSTTKKKLIHPTSSSTILFQSNSTPTNVNEYLAPVHHHKLNTSAPVSPAGPYYESEPDTKRATRRLFQNPFNLKNSFIKSNNANSAVKVPTGSELWSSYFVNDNPQTGDPVKYVEDFIPKLLQPHFGWDIEHPSDNDVLIFKNNFIENNQLECIYYISEFFQKSHKNFFAKDKTAGKVIISVKKDKNANLVKVIIRIKKGTVKLEIPFHNVKKLSSKVIARDIALNEGRFPNLTLTNIQAVDQPSLQEHLLAYEKADIFKRYKFGVLLVKDGQTRDDEFFENSSGSAEYEEFLSVLGKKIKLKNWRKYTGGLDTVGETTGEYSFFRNFHSAQKSYEIMFHVSTYIPSAEADKQHVERKRHLGNDVVNIIYNESSVPFNPASIVTNFIHVYIVIQLERELSAIRGVPHYRVEVASQSQVPKFNPPLRNPPIYSKEELHSWLPTKLINAERASFLAPAIRFKLISTRKQLLDDLFKSYYHEDKSV